MSADTHAADACGALGCMTTTGLQQYQRDGIVRTLCPSCGQDFMEDNR